jgi:hypothetical protein
MKTVFPSSELPHIWFHEKAPSGRCSSAIRFDGNMFYSYSTPIAAFHQLGDEKIVFLNSGRYSNTTTGHQSAVRGAIPSGTKVFHGRTDSVARPLSFVRDCITVAEHAITTAAELRASNPRKTREPAELEARAVEHIETAREVAEIFQLPEFIGYAWTQDKGEILARVEAARLKREADARAYAKRVELEANKRLKKWLAGDPSIHHFQLPSGKTFFRLKASGDALESSKGISMPLDEARRGLAFILSKRKTEWYKNGERFPIAGYELDSITKAGIVAGCHRFDWKEVARVSNMLKA